MSWLLVLAAVAGTTAAEEDKPAAAPPAASRLRIMVETDAGGDPDDEQSMVRFLLYTNEWDVEGIIANRALSRDGENLNPERTGLGVVRRLVDAYGECHRRLVEHDPRYPSRDLLLRRTVAGYEDTDDGVKLVIAAVDSPDPRPLWFLNWGTDNGSAPSCLRRALDRVLRERGKDGYARFKDRVLLSSDDQFGDHTRAIDPPFRLWVDTFRPPVEGKRWYHRFSALTARAGGFDVERDLRAGHGPLGALYPTNTTHPQKEGDTMTFLYLVPTGMNDPREPGWGSWAGRYGPRPGDERRRYFWAGEADRWQGTVHRDNTLRRWAADLQDDFRARLDWCVKPFREANHPPVPVVDGERGGAVIVREAKPGDFLELSAEASTDPDGDRLTFEWWAYAEAGTHPGPLVEVPDPGSPRLRFRVPAPLSPDRGGAPPAAEAPGAGARGAAGRAIHLILTVRDGGQPPLARYRRVVIRSRP